MRKGDRIIALNGTPVDDWQALETLLAGSQGIEQFTIQRNGETIDIEVQGTQKPDGGFRYGLTPQSKICR